MMNETISFRDTKLIPIWEKILRGERLSLADGLTLYTTNDLISLGIMAHTVQQRKSGDAIYFVINQKIEHTNVCVLSCKFCDFAARKGDPRAYEMTTEEIVSKITPDIREIHITGGMPLDWPWERYVDIVRILHQKFPEADIKAFTAIEIDFFHKKFKMPIEEVLRQLKEAGLCTMPGPAAGARGGGIRHGDRPAIGAQSVPGARLPIVHLERGLPHQTARAAASSREAA